MGYDELAKHCEALGYRDKLRLSQLLIQLARKEEEIQNPQTRQNLKEKGFIRLKRTSFHEGHRFSV